MGITVSERFIQQTKTISRSFEDQQLIVRDMIRMMRRTLKKIQTVYVKDLLYGLMERNMGTPEVINHAERMLRTRHIDRNMGEDEWQSAQSGTPQLSRDVSRGDRTTIRRRQQQGSRKNEIINLAMKSKVKDAWECIRREKRNEQQMWRQLRPKLRDRRKENEYNKIWMEEKDRFYREMRSKKKRKIKWIENKFYKKEKIPDTINGVTVKDQELDDRFKTKAVTYGGVELTRDEISVMEMHPKYTIFEKVDPIDCEAEIEKAMTKIRWARMEENKDKDVSGNRLGAVPRNLVELSHEETGRGNIGNGEGERTVKRETFDIDERKFDFRYARSTELPFNIRTNVPGPLENRGEEIRLQNLKMKLTEITNRYAEEKETEMENLTEEQKRGIKSLRKRQKDGEIVIFQTDKSGKLAADTPENYTEAAKPHFEKDTIVTKKEYEDTEKLINAHSVFWTRMLRAGEKTGDQERYKRSMKTENSKSSTLYVFRKDHKPCEDNDKGPPVRLLCDVSDSYGHKLSYFLSNILKEVTDKEPTVCDSTEDMLAGIRQANE